LLETKKEMQQHLLLIMQNPFPNNINRTLTSSAIKKVAAAKSMRLI